MELDAIAAVVLGGTAITGGGRGHIVGTLIGALLLGVLNNSLNMIGLSPYSQRVVKGVILLIAVLIGYLRKRGTRADEPPSRRKPVAGPTVRPRNAATRG